MAMVEKAEQLTKMRNSKSTKLSPAEEAAATKAESEGSAEEPSGDDEDKKAGWVPCHSYRLSEGQLGLTTASINDSFDGVAVRLQSPLELTTSEVGVYDQRWLIAKSGGWLQHTRRLTVRRTVRPRPSARLIHAATINPASPTENTLGGRSKSRRPIIDLPGCRFGTW